MLQDDDSDDDSVKNVNLKEVTSSEHNADILEMLQDGETSWNKKLFLLEEEIDGDDDEYVVREEDNLYWLGFFVGRHKELLEFHIKYLPEAKRKAFMDGFRQNTSIQELYVSADLGSDGYESLGYMLRNNNALTNLCFFDYSIDRETSRCIALMLGKEQYKSLKRLFFCRDDLSAEGIGEIATALGKQPQLEELKLCGNDIDYDGCVALENALESWEGASLRALQLCHNDIDDEGLEALVRGMKKCNYLDTLTLYGNSSITTAGLTSLSTFLQSKHCCLERLDVGLMNMDCEGVGALGLSKNKSLKCLSLSENEIGDEGMDALASSLCKCSNLEELHLCEDQTFSAVGLKSLSKVYQTGMNLKYLNLRDNEIDDEGLKALTEGMKNCCSLTKLDLSHNESITAVGLEALLRSCRSYLTELALWGMRIGDEGAKALASGLLGNNTMERVYFCPGYSGVTSEGWDAIDTLLCDPSSVNNTYNSNHTLSCIGGYQTTGPTFLATRFNIFSNNLLGSKEAAKLKILLQHHDMDMIPYFRWKMMFLPLIVDWFERAKPCLLSITDWFERKRYAAFGPSFFSPDNEEFLFDYLETELELFKSTVLGVIFKFVRGMPMLAIGREDEE